MEDIKNIFISKSGKLNNNYKLIFNKLDKELQERIISLFSMYDDLGDKLKSVIENDFRHCPVCDKSMSWKDKNKTCSKDCAKISLVENQEKTNLDRYGVRNAAQAEQFQLKMQETNLERYGVTHPLKNKDSLNKMQETNLERYGVNWVSQNDDVWNKQRATCIEKYDTEYAAQNISIQEKTKLTNLERYGVEHHFCNKEVIQKWKNSYHQNKIDYIKEHLGISVDFEFAKKIPIDIRRTYSKDYLKELYEFIMNGKKIDLELIRKEFENNQYRLTAKMSGYEFDNSSLIEIELKEWLINQDIECSFNNRNIISPYELDIFIPEHNLAIEFNGSYWHSEIYKDKEYHQMKTKMCNDLGITLIHIHEYLYTNKSEIYKNIIKSKLKLNDKVYARKCILKEVQKQEEKEFLEKYHLQGFVGSSKCYGLYYNNELLTLCSFGKSRFNKKYEYELLRNCTKSGISVVGGLSKLIKHYKKYIENKDIICYSDASISYNKNDVLTLPNYVWIKNSLIFKRYQTMKHKLENVLGDEYDSNLSESENMKKCGYYRVYDSGNYITIL